MYYISSVVWAEMRKQNSYKVCGAGQGPSAHCKHVTTVLYALRRLTADGTILTEQTCTQVLRTFHQAKPYTGNPLTTMDLQQLRGQKFTFDPRPADKINLPGYQSHLRNTVLGFQHEGRMPVTQLFQPANSYAHMTDHYYTGTSGEQSFIREEKIMEMTETQRDELERQTKGQHVNSLWRKQHTLRITSSNFKVICNATSKKDLSRLADQLVSPRQFTCRSVQHGLKYEAVAVQQQFETLHHSTEPCGMFTCVDAPWLAASPDRIVSDVAVLEVKCPFSAKDTLISPETVPYLKAVNNSLQLDCNHAYYFQIQGQLMCSNQQLCYFCIYTFKDMKVLEVRKDQNFIDRMFPRLQQFFQDHFLPAVLRRYVYRFYDKYTWDNCD